jgi:OOP family OmpA-OmpF porin
MLKKMAIGLVIGSAAAGTAAQTVTNIQANPNNSAYVQDSRGVIVRSQTGMCWRTGNWTPADAVAGCDGELLPPITKPTAPAIVTAPPVMAQAPAVPPAPKRCDFTVTLVNDQTFEFNKTVLSSAAKKRIDQEVLPKLASCAKVNAVLVTGHTDRLGSQQYNQKLSEKRAGMVAAYLKSKGAAQVDILGAGETQPIKSCDDKLVRAKLITCLAPNRRVTIEARGIVK